MAGTSLRDRFFTRQVARAITSPVGILLGGGVAAATIVAGVPLLAALPLGLAAWAGKVVLSIPRGRRGEGGQRAFRLVVDAEPDLHGT